MRCLLPVGGSADPEVAYAVEDVLDWHVRATFVSSADGAVTLRGRSGGLGGAADSAIFGLLRDFSDVILVGAGTARAEKYRSPRVGGDRLERRRRHRLPDAPVLALVSERLDLDPGGPLFEDGQTVVITHENSPAAARSALAAVADVVVAGTDAVDLALATDVLRARGLRRAHCEGGPRLFAAALAAGIVDELCLTVAGLVAGPGAGRIVSGPELPPLRLRLLHVLEAENDLFLRYAVRV